MNDIQILIENMENKLDQAAQLNNGTEFWCIHETQQLLKELKLKLDNNKMFEEVLMVEFPISDYMELNTVVQKELIDKLTFNLKLKELKFSGFDKTKSCYWGLPNEFNGIYSIFQAIIPISVLNDAELLDLYGYTKEDFKQIFN